MRYPFALKRSSDDRTTKKVFITGVILALFAAVFVMLDMDPLRQLDRISYDLMLRELGEKPANPNVLLVDIDEASLARYGQWPWPRHIVARMLDIIGEGRPASVGIDILFAEQDRTSLSQLREELRSDFGVELDLSNLAPEVIDHDKALARSLRKGPFSLGVMFRFGQRAITEQKLPDTTIQAIQVSHKSEQVSSYPVADGVVSTISELMSAAEGVGFVNVLKDPDGVVRRAPLFIKYDETFYPSLALIVYLQSQKRDNVILESNAEGMVSIRVGDTIIPVDRQGNIAIRFRGPSRTYTTISASDVLDGKISSDTFNSKIVFVGASAEGLMDNHSTPFDRHFPGVEVHASVAGAILDQDFISVPAWTTGAKGVGVFIAVMLALIMVMRFSTAVVAGGLFIGLLFIIPFGTMAIFRIYSVLLSPASTMVVFIISFSLLALVRFRSQEIIDLRRQRELTAAKDCAMVGLASLAETRDSETGSHILRTQKYIQILAQYLAQQRSREFHLQPEDIDLLVKSSPLHDVGKVGVPDSILLKPGPLTASEFEEMKKHTIYGAEALAKAELASGVTHTSSFLNIAREITLTHHEKWDGSGYPNGIEGADIPLSGRIMALVDVYDALISKRVYKEAMSHQEAVKTICNDSGTHFDPAIVNAFKALQKEFQTIAAQLRDKE